MDETFKTLSKIFLQSGYRLYLVGGYVRDYLLNKSISDYDLATDASSQEIKTIFPDADLSFAKYGFARINFDNHLFDIASFRREIYEGPRKIKNIEYIKDMKIDSNRRDFTINALYLDSNNNIYDFHNGKGDLKGKVIKIIGGYNRYYEDPLRLLRGIRFTYQLNFHFLLEENNFVKEHLHWLNLISLDLVKKEYSKLLKYVSKEQINQDYDFSEVVLDFPKRQFGNIIKVNNSLELVKYLNEGYFLFYGNDDLISRFPHILSTVHKNNDYQKIYIEGKAILLAENEKLSVFTRKEKSLYNKRQHQYLIKVLGDIYGKS